MVVAGEGQKGSDDTVKAKELSRAEQEDAGMWKQGAKRMEGGQN